MGRRLALLGIAAAAVGVAALALVLLLTGGRDLGERRLVAHGSGDRRLAPDVAVIRFAVTARAGTARRALDRTSTRLEGVIAAVRRVGVTEVRTEPARLARVPAQSGNPVPSLRPFAARQAVTVRIRRLDMAGRIVDAAVTAGATDVTGPRFELADPRAAHRRAVSDAVADARRKARAMAKTAGVRLGPIVRIAEGSDGSVPRATGRDASEAGPPVEPGRIRVRARVTITFAAEPA